MEIINIRQWGLNIDIPEGQPILISGPCSAETAAQVQATAEGLKQLPVHFLRAGIWKPRTRPNSFEGVGAPALPWIIEASQELGIPCCIEIATPYHAEQAIAAGVQALWIGARTSVNPFAVQAIADALQGIDIPVFVKNPINPDLQLWIGAIERIYNAGIRKIAAIHRGFSFYGQQLYRNPPEWEIPIELKRQIRGIEVICDPSHIAGKRELLLEIAQQALHLDFDGLMIESHVCPQEAWSDAAQQVTPKGLEQLLSRLVKPKVDSEDPLITNQLEQLRKEIDILDFKTLDLLAERMELVRQIGAYKKDNNIAILQIERWAKIYKSRTSEAEKLEVSQKFIQEIINAIHNESIQQQGEIMKKTSEEKSA